MPPCATASSPSCPAYCKIHLYVPPVSVHTPPEDQNAATPSTTLSSPTVRTYLSHSACSPQAAAAKRNPLTISPVYRSDRRRASKVRTRAPYTPPGLSNGTPLRTARLRAYTAGRPKCRNAFNDTVFPDRSNIPLPLCMQSARRSSQKKSAHNFAGLPQR